MNKDINKIAETYEDEGQIAEHNKEVSSHPWAYTQSPDKALKFADDIAYDPRLFVAGIVYGE